MSNEIDAQAKTVLEFWLFQQLKELVPGKYTLSSVLERLKSGLRFACTHLKGGKRRAYGVQKEDYNFSLFRYATGVTEIKCLYSCGLKVTDADNKYDFLELQELFRGRSSNYPASSEIYAAMMRPGFTPGPVPTYTDADRARIQERERKFWEWAKANPEEYRKQYGGVSHVHPDPAIANQKNFSFVNHDKIVAEAYAFAEKINAKRAAKAAIKTHVGPLNNVTVVFEDEGVPALVPKKKISYKTMDKLIRKVRKTQSRKSRKK